LIKTQVSLADTYKLIVTNSDNGCSKESSVVVGIDTLKPNLILSPTQILSCNQSTTSLTMNEGSGLSSVSYLWTDDGSFNETTSTINVTSAGTYHALMTNTDNGCTASGDVLVVNTTNTIIANAGPDVTLNCFQPIITIGESTSTSGTDIEYIWKNASDITVGIESTLNVAIPDTYYFTVKDTNTGCTASDTVVISIDTLSSIATIINTEDTINCVRNSIQLMGEVSNNSVTYDYNWYDTDLNFITNIQDLLITSGGDYHFEITRNDNGCKDTASVFIIDNTITPTIIIEQPDTITCKNSPVLLPINISSNSSSIQYHWTTSDGNIVLGTENSLSAYASSSGTYTVSVTDLQNGCNATESISTFENKTSPIADIIDDLELNCSTPDIELQDANTSVGTNFIYEWKDNSGSVVSSSYSLIANSSNTYSLIVTDTTNGCTAQDIVNITENKVYPSTVIGYSEDTITCNRLSIPITGNASNFGPSIVYSWYDANWDLIVSNVTELVVTSGGQYHFEAARGDNFCKDTFDFEINSGIKKFIPDVGTERAENKFSYVNEIGYFYVNNLSISKGQLFFHKGINGQKIRFGMIPKEKGVFKIGFYLLTDNLRDVDFPEECHVDIVEVFKRMNTGADNNFHLVKDFYKEFFPDSDFDEDDFNHGGGYAFVVVQ